MQAPPGNARDDEDQPPLQVTLPRAQGYGSKCKSKGKSNKGPNIVSLDDSSDDESEEKQEEQAQQPQQQQQQQQQKQEVLKRLQLQKEADENEQQKEEEESRKNSMGHTLQDPQWDQLRERARSDALSSNMTNHTSSMRTVDINITSSTSGTTGTERVRSVGRTPSFMGSASTAGSSKRRRDVLRSEQLRSSEVKDLLTFEGNESLLRGSSLSVVLRNWGGVFKSSKGSASTYNLSSVVAGIDSFVSHNWTVPRKAKYLALVYHYYFVRSVLAPCLVLALIGILYLTTEAALPTIIDKAEGYEVGIMARVLTLPTFVVMLFLYSDLQACCGGGPTVFLDKTCIHQEDASLMQQGISKLGAFIRESKQMLTIFSDEYLRKLWTVYEVASFLTLHATEDLKMLPTSVPRLVAIMLLCMYPMTTLGFVFKATVQSAFGQYIVTTFFAVLLVAAFRGVSREKAAISQTIANFSVKKCTCLCEDDRPVIYANIAVMMRKVLQLSDEMPEEKVLDQFDILVRNELPQALQAQMGRYIIPMNKVFVICFLFNFPFAIDLIPGYFVDDRPLRNLLVRMFGPVTWAFADSPSIVLVAQWLAMRFLVCQTRCRERAWAITFVFLSVGFLWIRSLVNTLLLNMALKNNRGLLLYVIYFLVSFLQVCWQGYGWSCCCAKRRKPDAEDSSSEVSNEASASNNPASAAAAREASHHQRDLTEKSHERLLLPPKTQTAAAAAAAAVSAATTVLEPKASSPTAATSGAPPWQSKFDAHSVLDFDFDVVEQHNEKARGPTTARLTTVAEVEEL